MFSPGTAQEFKGSEKPKRIEEQNPNLKLQIFA